MDVSIAYLNERVSSRDIRPFVVFCGVTVAFSLAGLYLGIPVAGLLPPALLICALIVKNPAAMLIVLFATFSIAIHISVFTADSVVLILMIGYWLLNKNELKGEERTFKWLRRFAWASIIWVGVLTAWHVDDFGASGVSVGTSVRLLLYYMMFIVALDLTQKMLKENILHILRWVWLFSVIVSVVAIFQHYALGESRVTSILEPFHAHLGNYAVVAIMICGVMSLWSDSRVMKIIGVATVLLSLVALVVSETRADILGAGVGLALFGLLRGVRGIVVVILIAGLLLGSGVVSRVLQKEEDLTFQGESQGNVYQGTESANYDASSVDRIFIWLGVLSMEQQANAVQMFTGVGPGNFQNYMRPYLLLHQLYIGIEGNSSTGAHNNYLQILVELGIGGLLLFGAFMVNMLLQFWRTRKSLDKRVSVTTSIVLAGTVALLASGFTQETFYSQQPMGNFFGFYLIVIVLLLNLVAENKIGDTTWSGA